MNLRIFLISLVLCGPGFAQPRIISGEVIDVDTRDPVDGVNIFISGSSLGVASDANGEFSINLPSGVDELILSHVSYQTLILSISKKSEYQIVLIPQVNTLNEVGIEVKKDKVWSRNYKQFKKAFLGTSINASDCEIVDPWVLSFEKVSGVLYASAALPLVIENDALGYNVQFYLQGFMAKPSSVTYAGKFHFELQSVDTETRKKQERKRALAYFGSSKHFINALINNSFEPEGFVVHEATRNSKDEFKIKRMLSYSDLIETDIEGNKMLTYSGYIRILYSAGISTPEGNSQISFLQIRGPLKLEKGGFYTDKNILEEYGFWSTQRIAELLPIDYIPGKK